MENDNKIVQNDKYNEKEDKFCTFYVFGKKNTFEPGNGTESAKAAGFAVRSAHVASSRLLRKDKIRRRIEVLRSKIRDEIKIDAEWVLKQAVEVTGRCMQRSAVMEFNPAEKRMEHATDPETGAHLWMFDSRGANQALQLISKYTGKFTDRQTITIDNLSEMAKSLGRVILEYVPEEKREECGKKIAGIIAEANE